MRRIDDPLPTVSIRELARKPGEVLDRVAKGDQLVVCRHNRPVALLRPVLGWPPEDPSIEGNTLTPDQRSLLMNTSMVGRFRRTEEKSFPTSVRELELLGLARRVPGQGAFITGRG